MGDGAWNRAATSGRFRALAFGTASSYVQFRNESLYHDFYLVSDMAAFSTVRRDLGKGRGYCGQ